MKYLPGMLTCRELEAFLDDYLEGLLSPRQRRRFEWHLKLCRDCRRYLEGYRRAVALCKGVFAKPDAPVPDDVPEDLVRAVLAARSS